MAEIVTPTDLQKVEFNVTTAEGPCRVTIVTGRMDINFTVFADRRQSRSFKALIDPTLTAAQFRRAAAIASFSGLSSGVPSHQWFIDDAQATFDDEAGKVQLIVDVTAESSGGGQPLTTIKSICFQVTTLARV
jgi:hypothetical protein